MTPKLFLRMLLKKTKLRELRLHSTHYSSLLRYTAQKNVSPISLALSIMKKDAYFSHASAMWIHGLGKDDRNVFVNKEQSQKHTGSAPPALSQDAIHSAFRSKQRRSKLFYKHEESPITVLSGKHTGRMGVVSATAPSGHKVDVTSIERTLIDITVRPSYAGDVLVWGAGFGLAVRKKWPKVQDDFAQWAVRQRGNLALGNLHISSVDDSLVVAHLVAQHGVGPSKTPRVRYGAIESSLSKLAEFAAAKSAAVHMPRIGTGQAGGSWEIVGEIIEDTLCKKKVEVTVYDLPSAGKQVVEVRYFSCQNK
jgi:O-acetyl-ADP-ribose deacetylase (regulator of RNase III)